MRSPSGRSALVVVVSLLVPSGALASCTSAGCGDLGYDGTVAGRLTGVHDQTATYAVESVDGIGTDPPKSSLPAVGKPFPVRYAGGEARFLRVGDSYRFDIVWDGKEFVSSVGESCTATTRYADDSAIQTIHASWLKRNRVELVATLAPLLALLAVSAFAWRRRRPRAQTVRR